MAEARFAEFFVDGQQRRVRLWDVTDQVLTKLLKDLASNYISTIPSPNYAVFQKAIAQESGLARIVGDDLEKDGYYDTTRAAFLYQILGALLHGTQVEKFSPPGYTDEQYRRFLLSLKTALFGGSRPRNIEKATQIFTQTSVKVIELFKLSPPRDPDGIYDISDQFMWRYEIEVPEVGYFDLTGLQEGLHFLTRIMKPAHTLYELRLIYRDTYYSLGRCITLLGSLGYLRASRIIVDKTPRNNVTPIDGVIEGTADGDITLKTLPDSLRVGNNVRVKVTPFTIIKDEYNVPLTYTDLKVGDRIFVQGTIVDAPITPDGFYYNVKIEPTAICDRDKLAIYDYAYEDLRKCCEDTRELKHIVGEDITLNTYVVPGYLASRTFYTKQGPFTNSSGAVTDVVTAVTVYVNGIHVSVQKLFPYIGVVVLTVTPPAGSIITINYHYFEEPYVNMQLNTFGLLLNDYHNEVIGRIEQNSVLRPAPFSTCSPIEVTYNYKGFQLAYSAVLNDTKRFTLLLNDISRLAVNGSTLNHYNVIDSTSPIVKIGGDFVGPEDLHFLSGQVTLPVDTPIMKLTMDILNAQKEYIIDRSLSDILNSLTDLLTSLTLPLRLNYISYNLHNEFRYAIYSCIEEFLSKTISGTGGRLAIACDKRVDIAIGGLSETYSNLADARCAISLQPFILNDVNSELTENVNERDRMGPIGVLLI